MCIELHSRNFKIFVWTWNKIKGSSVFSHIKKESKSTTIDVFSTFLLLSYAKIVGHLVDTIDYETNFVLNMNNLQTLRVLRVDSTIEWLGTENIPYIVVSVFLLVVVVFPPVLLLTFYPVKFFRSLLLKCLSGGHARAALNIFVEKFYDSYRDGLDGGRDMRGLASLYFILRIFVNLFSIVEEFLVFNALLLGGTAIFIAIIRPYKKTYMNIIDTLLLASLSFILLLFDLYFKESLTSGFALFYALVIGFIGSLPMWFFLGYVACKIIPFNRLLLFMKKRKDPHGNELEDGTTKQNKNLIKHVEIELPDRIVNPGNYALYRGN